MPFLVRPGVVLTSHYQLSHKLSSLPPIDAVLLSHGGHADNMDPIGQHSLDGYRVLTTVEGTRKLSPCPGDGQRRGVAAERPLLLG
ncbi:Zn-dependent hydrolase of the beta-lactamase [Apiospora rasikravindrae]|uniref:Zn-dependent hydrolase of the beta-lactamase n=1 Tax=Apiospora rasikravindrae TaxID=990691 RepID=A0ABR1RSE9_9PEZI